MKHIADRNYKDLTLNKHIEKDAVLEEEYEKAGVELTEERKRYLVDERKLYKKAEEEEATPVVEDNNEAEEEEATPVVEDNNEEAGEEEAAPVEDNNEEAEEEETAPVEDNNEEAGEEEAAPVEDNNEEAEEEEAAPTEETTTKRDSNKNKTKNTKKSNQK